MAHVLGLDISDEEIFGAMVRVGVRSMELVGYYHVALRSTTPPPEAYPGDRRRPMPPPPPVPTGIEPINDERDDDAVTQIVSLEELAARNAGAVPEGSTEPPRGTGLRSDPPGRTGPVARLSAQLPAFPETVIAHISGTQVSLRALMFPAALSKRVDDLIPSELEDSVPFELDEAIWSQQQIERTAESVRVLVAAARVTDVGERLGRLSQIGVDPKTLAVGPVALDALSALMPNAAAEDVAFIYVARHETDVCLVRSGRCVRARTLSISAAQSRDVPSRMAHEVLHTLAAHQAEGGARPSLVLLGGPADVLNVLQPVLNEALGIPVEICVLPTREIGLAAQPSTAPADAPRPDPRYMRAAALAARALTRGTRIDLRKGPFVVKRSVGSLRKHAKLLIASSLLVATSLVFATLSEWRVSSRRALAARAELERATTAILGAPMASIEDAKRELSTLESAFDPLPEFDAFQALSAVSELVPTDIQHDTQSLRIELGAKGRPGQIEINGMVPNIEDRDRIASALEGFRCFKDIDKGRTSPAIESGRITYQLTAAVECPGSASAKSKKGSHRRSSDSSQ